MCERGLQLEKTVEKKVELMQFGFLCYAPSDVQGGSVKIPFFALFASRYIIQILAY